MTLQAANRTITSSISGGTLTLNGPVILGDGFSNPAVNTAP